MLLEETSPSTWALSIDGTHFIYKQKLSLQLDNC